MTLFRKMYKTAWNLQETHKMFDDMKNLIIVLLLLEAGIQSAFAQKGKDIAEGTGYYLPRMRNCVSRLRWRRPHTRRASLPFMLKNT